MAAFNSPPRVNVLGVGISVLNLDSAVETLASALASGQRGYVTITGVHGVIESQNDPELRRIHNTSLLSTPDGMPLVWMGKLAGHRSMDRVYGPDLMERLMTWSQTSGATHYFYGGAPGVAEELKVKLEDRFPGIRIVGTSTPPFRPLTPEELVRLSAEVAELQPDFFWVGLSTPKQERFMAAHQGLLDAKIMVGVGAAFDFHSGRIAQAPRWIQRSGFEWLFRLSKDFKRLWPRYSRIVPLFLFKAAGQLSGLRRYSLE
ncbi:MAG TPA: WecB/TagA/CpsF family glycosyltransferase [Verrucomicrobiota bacterium]|nr:glycosyltransferase [Verrucomicrobiales bacterium]HRI14195.1 WecB/TagA/CpsF family glycosyltransferase [Verrucomicrobiota bacterium]